MIHAQPVVGLILAGGLARRMGGGDKCLLPLAGKTLLQRTLDRALPQVDELLLNANGNSLRFARSHLPIVADLVAGHPGPLAGIHAGLSWLKRDNPNAEWLMSFACDTPFFPQQLVAPLLAQARSSKSQVAVACCNGQMHPTFALWHASLLTPIDHLLRDNAQVAQRSPSLREWIQQQRHTLVNFATAEYDPFFNINTPQDLYLAEQHLPLANNSTTQP